AVGGRGDFGPQRLSLLWCGVVPLVAQALEGVQQRGDLRRTAAAAALVLLGVFAQCVLAALGVALGAGIAGFVGQAPFHAQVALVGGVPVGGRARVDLVVGPVGQQREHH